MRPNSRRLLLAALLGFGRALAVGMWLKKSPLADQLGDLALAVCLDDLGKP